MRISKMLRQADVEEIKVDRGMALLPTGGEGGESRFDLNLVISKLPEHLKAAGMTEEELIKRILVKPKAKIFRGNTLAISFSGGK